MQFSRRGFFIVLADLLIALFSFWLVRYLVKLPRWYWLVLSAVLWVLVGVATRKLMFSYYRRRVYAFVSILVLDAVTGVLLFFAYRYLVPEYRYDKSILVATGLIVVLEWLLYTFYHNFVYKQQPYFYEITEDAENCVPFSESVLGGMSAAESSPVSETAASGNDATDAASSEKASSESASSSDPRRLTVSASGYALLLEKYIHEAKDNNDFRNLVAEHIGDFGDATVIMDTGNPEHVLSDARGGKVDFIIHLRSLNNIRHQNTFLSYTNYCLPEGGYIMVHCVTSGMQRQRLLAQNPPVVGHVLYVLHYLWRRVCPKLFLIGNFYMWVTKGRNRSITRVEVLGKLYRAGFEVMSEEISHGEFYVIARKERKPVRDDHPSSGVLIRLRRKGKNGKEIGVYKFRTMHSYSEYLQPYVYEYEGLQDGGKFASDYRVSRLGKFMRRFWLDELPMFINVIRGDMKIVGVRPLSNHYLSLYTPEMQALHLSVKPGLLPPFYYDKQSPKTIEDVQASERRYILAYQKHPLLTDLRYFFGTIGNILLRRKHSE